ncbi:adenylyl-sulfate kinase [Pseudomonas sp. SO81]|uniref:adenylyl-sulfate kinase n=1 Tax=Pseudomonas sp. SO81 TaxID=2983246 RepID=UPI0025A35279|nr:adenylyl-sulfate kinase [Pseudomonas sp. SO81]WJN59946.1 Adenylylsulfate kinase [Pseudomonas sp. SO81]
MAKPPYEVKPNESASFVVWNHTSVTPQVRAQSLDQQPRCIWFTGLSGSGKSTLANALEVALQLAGMHTMLLDGDNVRHGLCKDLGMSAADRNENIRRVAETAKLMVDAGLVVIAAFISPFREDRARARQLFGVAQFHEVYLQTSLAVCEARDPKGLYRMARDGKISDFTGIDSPYEAPDSPEVVLDTAVHDVDTLVLQLLEKVFPERWSS